MPPYGLKPSCRYGRGFGHLQVSLETSEDEEGLLPIPAFKTQLHPSHSPSINLLLPCSDSVLGEGMWHLCRVGFRPHDQLLRIPEGLSKSILGFYNPVDELMGWS